MNRWLSLLVLGSLLCLANPGNLLSAQITIDSEAQFTFARHLMEKKAYTRAITEFERLIYFFPEDQLVPEAGYFIGLCHFKNKAFEEARKICLDLYRDFPKRALGGKALFLIGETYYTQRALPEAERYFKMVIERYPDSDLRNRAVYRLGWSRMQGDQWREAADTFAKVDRKCPLSPSAADLSERSLQGEALPGKSPTTAGITAGVLPGLGHAYCGRYKDGVVAFLLNGLFIWAAYESFDNDHEVLGGILTFLELGWYSGNIYSAVNCAHKHNRAVRNKYRQGLKDHLDLSLFTTGERDLGLVLKYAF